jgi:hypothetical protein
MVVVFCIKCVQTPPHPNFSFMLLLFANLYACVWAYKIMAVLKLHLVLKNR